MNCDMGLKLALRESEGALQVDFSDVKMEMNDYNVRLEGNSDMSRTVEIMFKNFKNFI
eukprot:CAMPEP_0170464956 /NCGR_PEP_ID=MMETSP0123-20130129/9479_1 /TAXON_ID=182087 /ORGANISM="Favella ehrenbergii, Strain Fehren 1" /LENGTH=57 /DNA_ID=CAMNT_0010730729 /DNA_START=512 /DNA_END=685 /DNA_ORIENTATION=+